MIKPFYQDERTLLYCCDNEEILAELPEKSIDNVITDPPFSEWTHIGARTNPEVDADGVPLSGGNEGQPMIDFAPVTSHQLGTAFDRIGYATRRWVIASMDWRHYAELERLPPAFLRPVRLGVWDKPNGAPQFTGDRPGQGWEAIGIFHRLEAWRENVTGRRHAIGGRMRWNGGGHRAVWRHNRISDPFNPTAKPPELVAQLIELFTDPGDLILDPWCGTGTTLLQARALGRLAIGIERDPEQCEEIVRRLRPTFGQAVRKPRRPQPLTAAGPMFETVFDSEAA